MGDESCKPYPSDVTDEEWAFVATYLALVREDAPQRRPRSARGLERPALASTHQRPWRTLPHDPPPWEAVYQQTPRWLDADVFAAIAHDLWMLLREAVDRMPQPQAAILNSRTGQSMPESGARAGFDGHRRRRGSKVHVAVDTLGHLLALVVTPAKEQDRAQVERLA